MNQQERDEIRAKHKPTVWYQGCEGEHPICEECSAWQDGSIEVDFPCWAIKYVDTLDAWEAEKANDTNTAHCLCGSGFPCKYQGLHKLVGEPAERIEINNDHPVGAENAKLTQQKGDFMKERWEVELKFVKAACDNTDGYWDTMIDEFHDLAVKHGMGLGVMSCSARRIQPKRQKAGQKNDPQDSRDAR